MPENWYRDEARRMLNTLPADYALAREERIAVVQALATLAIEERLREAIALGSRALDAPMNRLVRVIVTEDVPPDALFVVGGVRIVKTEDDAVLGREMRTTEVRCRPKDRERLEAEVVKMGLGMA